MADQSDWTSDVAKKWLAAQPPIPLAATDPGVMPIGPPSPAEATPDMGPIASVAPASPYGPNQTHVIDNGNLQIGGGMTLPTSTAQPAYQMRQGQLRPGEVALANPSPELAASVANAGSIIQPPGSVVPQVAGAPATTAASPSPQPQDTPAAKAASPSGPAGPAPSPFVALHTAEDIAAQQGNFEKQAEDVKDVGKAKNQAARGEAGAIGDEAVAAQQAAEDIDRAEKRDLARQNPVLAKIQSAADQQLAYTFTNPDKRSTGQRIADGIFAALAGAGMGLAGKAGQNPVVDQINRDIGLEVSRQKEEFNKIGAAAATNGNLVAHYRALGLDEKGAVQAAAAHTADEWKQNTRQWALLSGQPVTTAQAQLLSDGIDANRIQAHMADFARAGGGGKDTFDKDVTEATLKILSENPGMATADAHRAALQVVQHNRQVLSGSTTLAGKEGHVSKQNQEEGAQLDNAIEQLEELTKIRATAGRGGTWSPAETARADSLRANALFALAGAESKGGRFNRYTIDTLKQQLGGSATGMDPFGGDAARLKQTLDSTKARRDALAGVKPTAGFVK